MWCSEPNVPDEPTHRDVRHPYHRDERESVDESERDPVLAQHVIPDARVLAVPAAAHGVLIEQPQIGSAATIDLINEVETR